MLAVGEVLNVPLARLFVGYDRSLLDLTTSGFRIFALSLATCDQLVHSGGISDELIKRAWLEAFAYLE